ncbi:MAG: HupE/UreJ family protein [Pseudomonadota bacterium]|nr:HupE/UreJ family protein [Pseudomonadota bacterium]
MRRRFLAVSRFAIVLAYFALGIQAVQAHEVRPGYLEISEFDERHYDVLWKVPAKGDRRLGLYVLFPETCTGTEPTSRFIGGGYLERWRVSCEETLTGRDVTIGGLPATRTDVLARFDRADGTTQTVRLTPAQASFTVSASSSAGEVIATYLALGIEHILLGVDHLLFVLALLFLVRSWPRLIGTVTAFTVAHSLTLVAATLGWVSVPLAPVEAAIALSIVFVATEILHARQGRPGLAARAPWVVAFVFGLLHGLGFAGALREVGLPENAIPLALAFFNIGVEIGQLLFIAAVFVLLWSLNRIRNRLSPASIPNAWGAATLVSLPAAYVIGTLAAYWVFERTWGFWA